MCPDKTEQLPQICWIFDIFQFLWFLIGEWSHFLVYQGVYEVTHFFAFQITIELFFKNNLEKNRWWFCYTFFGAKSDIKIADKTVCIYFIPFPGKFSSLT